MKRDQTNSGMQNSYSSITRFRMTTRRSGSFLPLYSNGPSLSIDVYFVEIAPRTFSQIDHRWLREVFSNGRFQFLNSWLRNSRLKRVMGHNNFNHRYPNECISHTVNTCFSSCNNAGILTWWSPTDCDLKPPLPCNFLSWTEKRISLNHKSQRVKDQDSPQP